MALDSKYIAAFSFAEVILDKDSAFPLANGLVYFYKDQARTQLKEIFQLVGAPTYSYVALPNPVKLSSLGTFQDLNGNDIVPYFYPYDSTGNVELYYVTFYSSADGITPDVFQFDREAVPSEAVSQGGEGATETKNYASDGQFLLHTDIPATATTDAGEITSDITVLSQGGWTFERSAGATSKDVVQFNAIASAITNPTGNPKFTCDSICYIPDPIASYKSLRLKFYDVNKFASDTQQYTISFYAKSNAGSPLMNINLIKNFGTGGSPSASTSMSIASDITVPLSFAIMNFPFVFGTNIGKTLGTNGDDFLQIDFAFPASSAYDIEITDVALVKGSAALTEFPIMANDEMLGRSIAGWAPVPAYDGSDLYLPLVLSETGLAYDDSKIGKIEMTLAATLGKGELWVDGAQYETSARSADGIPYSRLQAKLWNSSIQTPIAGTGLSYMTAIHEGTDESTTKELIVSNNTCGTVTNASDGTVATGFTISNIHTGTVSNYVSTYYENIDTFYIRNLELGDGTINVHTSGFTVTDNVWDKDGVNNILRNLMSVKTIVATGLAGKYFTFTSWHGSPGSTQSYYVWYKVGGTGTDPAPGGTGILVNLIATDTANVVAIKTAQAINGFQNTSILTVAGSAVPVGSYFNIYSTADQFYVWYKVDGVGTDPVVSGAIGIEVDILSADTDVQVAKKTQAAINMKYYAVPDYRGIFLRGAGGSLNNWDPDATKRFSSIPGLYGDILGAYEMDANISHQHGYSHSTTIIKRIGGGGDTPYMQGYSTLNSSLEGYSDARPINAAVNYIIKY